jgi:predicted HD superfamily hydrolase involved in NAD metabolism
VSKKAISWKPKEHPHVEYEPWQRLVLKRVEADTKVRLASAKHRLTHTLSVAAEAEHLALIYGVDPFLARLAGYFHDWDKVVPNDELIKRAHRFGIDLGVPLELAEPLLHGMVVARELPERYPHIPHEVWHAVACHTSAAEDMNPLDMVLFVADGIEPTRRSTPGIERTRSLVGESSLEDLFWCAFVGGLVYVLEGGRYLLPRSLDIYNTLAAERAAKRRTKE